jgi:hypothetical protein
MNYGAKQSPRSEINLGAASQEMCLAFYSVEEFITELLE